MKTILFLYTLFLPFYISQADIYSDSDSSHILKSENSNRHQSDQPWFKGVDIQLLFGAGSIDFPDFNTDYEIDGRKPGHRESFFLSILPKIMSNRHHFFELGYHFLGTTGEYFELNTEGDATTFSEQITILKAILGMGIGTGFHIGSVETSISLGINGNLGLTGRKNSNSKNTFYSLGIGMNPAIQITIPLKNKLKIPIRLGYFISKDTALRSIWPNYWYDHIAQKNKTQSCNGPFLMVGITF